MKFVGHGGDFSRAHEEQLRKVRPGEKEAERRSYFSLHCFQPKRKL